MFCFLTPALLFVLVGTYYTILGRRLFSTCDLSPSNSLQIIISALPADTLPEARATKPTGTVPSLSSRFFSYTGKRKKKKRWSWAKWSSAIFFSWSRFSCVFRGWVKRSSQGPDQSPISNQGGRARSAAGCGISSSCWISSFCVVLQFWLFFWPIYFLHNWLRCLSFWKLQLLPGSIHPLNSWTFLQSKSKGRVLISTEKLSLYVGKKDNVFANAVATQPL